MTGVMLRSEGEVMIHTHPLSRIICRLLRLRKYNRLSCALLISIHSILAGERSWLALLVYYCFFPFLFLASCFMALIPFRLTKL